MSESGPNRAPGRAAWLVAAGLALWIFWLRWPSFGGLWNLDEGIHTTVARTILDGGVMYRDAIDQRTPLSYYLTAIVLAVAGQNNLWALHAWLAAMISATAFGLFQLGRRWGGMTAGLWSAAVFAALAMNLLYVGDAYAIGTEWFVILFTSWGAVGFDRIRATPSFWPAAGVGAAFAAAFLCKQPALLEIGAPLGVALFAGFARRLPLSATLRLIGGLLAGFGAVLAATFAYFAARGALADFYFYAWTYNLVYYAADTSLAGRIHAAAALGPMLGAAEPAVLIALVAGVVLALIRLVQREPTPDEQAQREPDVFLLLWLATSVAGAASSGRQYGHYYIEAFPALALAAGRLLGAATEAVRAPKDNFRRALAAALVLAAGWSVLAGPVAARGRAPLGPDASTSAADFVRDHSAASDRIFVWGFNPDFYLLAQRAPASRFIYCSFPTGLVPWVNAAPGRNTDDTVVPGTMATLLAELERTLPVFFVDTSLNPYRAFTKYPLAKFPRLERFVTAHYVEVDPLQFRPHGFRVLVLKDAARRAPLALAGGARSQPGAPAVRGLASVDPVPSEYEVQAEDPAGRLQRLELLVDDQVTEAVSLPPSRGITARFIVHFETLAHGPHRLAARATAADGSVQVGPPLTVENAPPSLPAAQLAGFALPVLGPGPVPVRVSAPYGATAREEAGSLVFFAHAPSQIAYDPVPPGARRLQGRFGFRPGAYAADNAGRTDGAEFIVRWSNSAGKSGVLVQRFLRPVEVPADRGEQPFDVEVPAGAAGGRLEFVITNGPAANAASDWTYWTGLQLTISH